MDLQKYIARSGFNNGDIITEVFFDILSTREIGSILFVRTPTTGGWLDYILPNDERITRIAYSVRDLSPTPPYHKDTIIVGHDEFPSTIAHLDKKFDVICIDPFHEYEYCIDDFNLLINYLSPTGILLSHDCFPPHRSFSTKTFKYGAWSGETYVALTELAYNNPGLYYGLINTDTGIGIVSKLQFDKLRNDLDSEKQRAFIELHKDESNDIYGYFLQHCRQMINTIGY